MLQAGDASAFLTVRGVFAKVSQGLRKTATEKMLRICLSIMEDRKTCVSESEGVKDGAPEPSSVGTGAVTVYR